MDDHKEKEVADLMGLSEAVHTLNAVKLDWLIASIFGVSCEVIEDPQINEGRPTPRLLPVDKHGASAPCWQYTEKRYPLSPQWTV